MKTQERGFTLIELIIVIALIAIMIGLAAPSFVRFQRSSQLTSVANSFIAAMAAARAEAMRHNRDAYVKPVSGNDWTTGWKVFVDVNKDGSYADGTDVLVLEEPAVPSSVTTPTISGVNQFSDGSNSYVLFNGSGFPRLRNGTFGPGSLEFNVDSTLRRRVISSPSGRMRVCNPVTEVATCVQ